MFAVIFLHILVSPLLISAWATVDTDKTRGRIKIKLFFIPVFVKTVDLGKIKSIFEEKQDEQKSEQNKSKSSGGIKAYFLRVAKAFITRIRVRVVDIDGVMGSGDAAVTAVAVGSVGAGYDSARAVLGFDGDCNIRAEYDYERIFLDLYGIISFSLADTIFALIAGAVGGARKNAVRREVYG